MTSCHQCREKEREPEGEVASRRMGGQTGQSSAPGLGLGQRGADVVDSATSFPLNLGCLPYIHVMICKCHIEA